MEDKYLIDGRKVIVENETIDGKFVVRTVFNVKDDDSWEDFEHQSNNVIVVCQSQLCEKPPTEKYENTIEDLKKKISEATEDLGSFRAEVVKSRTELAIIKRDLTDNDLETAHTINRLGTFIENPSVLIDYFLGKFTHIVVDDRHWPTLVSFEEQYRKKLSLMCENEGKRRAVLNVKTTYDYWRTGVPCKSKEEALAVLKTKIEYAHIDKPGVMIEEAAKHGITVDQKYIDKHDKAKSEEKEKKRRKLKEEIKELDNNLDK